MSEYFKKEILIPVLAIILANYVSIQTTLVRYENLEARLNQMDVRHVSKNELTAALSEVKFRSDDPYKGSDAVKDFALRDSELNVIRESIKELKSYMTYRYPDWRSEIDDRGKRK